MHNHFLFQATPFQAFRRYVSFNIASMMALSCYILADSYFIANGVGADGLAALNLVLPVYNLIYGLGMMAGIGAAAQYAMAIGRRQFREGSRYFTVAFIASLSAGLVITVLGVAFTPQIVTWLGADAVIKPLAEVYLRTIVLFTCFFMINQVFTAFIRNDEGPRLAMLAMIISSLANVVLDYILIIPLGMGMFGAALATALSPVISLAVLSMHYWRDGHNFHFTKVTAPRQYLARIVITGTPSLVTEFATGISMMCFNFMILALAGNVGLAAYGIITNVTILVMATFNGLGQGVQPIVSVYRGAGYGAAIKKIWRYAAVTALAMGILLVVGSMWQMDLLIRLFNRDDDPLLRQIASEGIAIYFQSFLLMGVNFMAIAFFAAIGEAKKSLHLALLRGIVLPLPLLFLFAHHWGLTGVWLDVPVTEALTVVLVAIYYHKAKAGFTGTSAMSSTSQPH